MKSECMKCNAITAKINSVLISWTSIPLLHFRTLRQYSLIMRLLQKSIYPACEHLNSFCCKDSIDLFVSMPVIAIENSPLWKRVHQRPQRAITKSIIVIIEQVRINVHRAYLIVPYSFCIVSRFGISLGDDIIFFQV